ncbi:MAG TPA: hypothetical protein VNE17_10240, partial [Nitrolancea sp.]|nr:hypothetical protein [Nitrolancea sp.]
NGFWSSVKSIVAGLKLHGYAGSVKRPGHPATLFFNCWGCVRHQEPTAVSRATASLDMSTHV